MEIFKRQIPRSIIFKSLCGANFSRQTPSIVRHRYFNYQGQKTKVEKKGDCDYKSNQIKNPCDMDIVYHWHSFEADVRRELDAVSSVCVLLRQFLKVQLISKNKVYEIVVMLHYFFVAICYFFTLLYVIIFAKFLSHGSVDPLHKSYAKVVWDICL